MENLATRLRASLDTRQLALQGLIHARRGEYPRALELLGEAALLLSTDIKVRRVLPELSFKLADNAIRQHRLQQALDIYELLLPSLPDHSVGHYSKAKFTDISNNGRPRQPPTNTRPKLLQISYPPTCA